MDGSYNMKYLLSLIVSVVSSSGVSSISYYRKSKIIEPFFLFLPIYFVMSFMPFFPLLIFTSGWLDPGYYILLVIFILTIISILYFCNFDSSTRFNLKKLRINLVYFIFFSYIIFVILLFISAVQ